MTIFQEPKNTKKKPFKELFDFILLSFKSHSTVKNLFIPFIRFSKENYCFKEGKMIKK